MIAVSALLAPGSSAAASSVRSVCPFHDGPETLDGLLAEIDLADTALLDACLDLRSLLAVADDAETCVAQALRLRALLDGRHYLAFYRLRCWLRRVIVIEVRRQRGENWCRFALPLDGARVEEIVNDCLGRLSDDATLPPAAAVRFAFAENRVLAGA